MDWIYLDAIRPLRDEKRFRGIVDHQRRAWHRSACKVSTSFPFSKISLASLLKELVTFVWEKEVNFDVNNDDDRI